MKNSAESIVINNAGVILLWPYFSVYFQRLGLVKDTMFVSDEAAVRAAKLLHYIVTGREDHSEHEMYLNKLLCHVPDNVSTEGHIELSLAEKELSDQLLQSVIANWEKLKNTSIEGLRETFLKRAGKLNKQEGNYSLVVEHAPFDVLLATLPWNISVIRLPWMNGTLSVTWR
ncbi:MAG: contractile injection system tape measure protein [Bacteroidota bacterium]